MRSSAEVNQYSRGIAWCFYRDLEDANSVVETGRSWDSCEMRVTLTGRPSADVVVIGFFSDRKPAPGALDAVSRTGVDVVAAVRGTPPVRGGLDDAPVVIPPTAAKRPTIIVVGLGSRTDVDAAAIRSASMRAATLVRGRRTIATTLGLVGDDRPESVRAAVEGTIFGCFQRPRPESESFASHEALPESVAVAVSSDDLRDRDVKEAATRGLVTGEQLNWVRTLTDTPAGHLTPATLAAEIARDAMEAGVTANVWSQERIREQGFGGLLAVARGSAELPQVVELSYGDQTAPLGLTGKGVTFDAGGINLKKLMTEVHWMKSDMASAAAVAGAIHAAARFGSTVGVRAILPLTENMVSGTATRPGDIAVHPNGMTTEVLDTDCEGRVVLADGIAYLTLQGVSGVIDVGTLTDAAGFGPDLWAGASNDDSLMGEVLGAGYASGDRGWQMPLVPGYVEIMRSKHADLINGPITVPDSSVLAATYLRQFAGETPWVHIDTGSKAYITDPWDAWPAGATGSPMRALLRVLEDREVTE